MELVARGNIHFAGPGGTERQSAVPDRAWMIFARNIAMKTIWMTALAAAALTVSPAMGQQSDDGGDDRGPGMMQGASQGDGMMMNEQDPDRGMRMQGGGHGMGMMMQGDMEMHREHMSRMRELMAQARDAETPEERRQLVEQHDELMQAHMDAMMDDNEQTALMMRHCGQRMSMMHDMMQQMRARQQMMMDGSASAESGG